MSRRWIVFAGAALVVLLLLLVAVPFVIDVNRYRPELESKASTALGRKVTLGRLRLSIFSGTVVAHDIAIADDPKFSNTPFLTAERLRIGVEVAPLIFARKLNIKSLTIDQPQIALIRSANGIWNYSSLNKLRSAHPDGPKTDIFVHKLTVTDGTLTVGRQDAKPQVYNHYNVDATDVSPGTRFQFTVNTQLPGGGSANLIGNVGPIDATDAARTSFEATLKATDVHLASFADPSTGIEGVVDLDETVSSDGSVIKAEGLLSGTRLRLSPTGSPLPKTISMKHAVSVGIAEQTGVVTFQNADITFGRAHLITAGTLQSSSTGLGLDLKLHGSKMPLDDLQPLFTVLKVTLPTQSHFRGGTLSLDLTATGTGAAPTVAGSLQIEHTTLVGFNLGAQLGSMAAVAGKAISRPDTNINQLNATIVATNAGVKVQSIRSDIEGIGVSTGSGFVDPKGNQHLNMLSSPTGGVVGNVTKLAAKDGVKGWVPLTIEGTSANPVFKPDSKAAAHNAMVLTGKNVVASSKQAISKLFNKNKDKENDKNKDGKK